MEAKASTEIKISASGKPYDLATKALHTVKVCPISSLSQSCVTAKRAQNHSSVVISSSGKHVGKAVTVAELLKRRQPGLIQETTIKYTRTEDMWEPDMKGLDHFKVVRRIPAISIKFTENDQTEEKPDHVGSKTGACPRESIEVAVKDGAKELHSKSVVTKDAAGTTHSKSEAGRDGGSFRGGNPEKEEKGQPTLTPVALGKRNKHTKTGT